MQSNSISSAWASKKIKEKWRVYYTALEKQYQNYIKDDDFLTIPEALEDTTTKTISLLTTYVRAWMEETLKSLQISPRIKAKRLNAMWDIMLANEYEKQLASSVLTAKAACLQTE